MQGRWSSRAAGHVALPLIGQVSPRLTIKEFGVTISSDKSQGNQRLLRQDSSDHEIVAASRKHRDHIT